MVKILRFDKEMLNKVRDDVNLLFFESSFFKVEDMKLVNNIVEGLENVKIYTNN